MTHHLDLDTLVLRGGGHTARPQVCLMEAVAWWADEKHTDQPECVSPVLAAFGRSWNDGMRSDEEREQLKPYIPRLVGTAGDAAADEVRGWLATDWLVRVCAPSFLRLTPSLVEHADRLAALAPVTSAAYAATARGDIAAAWDAAQAAARDAAGAAARAAARNAAVDAAWAAAGAVLETVIAELQVSAHELFDAMIEVRS